MADGKKEVPQVSIKISPGEALDRLAILGVKMNRVRDPKKRARAAEAHAELSSKLLRFCDQADTLDALGEPFKQLYVLHNTLWQVENTVRRCEQAQDFGATFVQAARRVYDLNDERSTLKNKIDDMHGCPHEVKEYHGQEEETR